MFKTSITSAAVFAALAFFSPHATAAPAPSPVSGQYDFMCAAFNQMWEGDKENKTREALVYLHQSTSTANVKSKVALVKYNCRNAPVPSYMQWMDPKTLLTPEAMASLLKSAK